MYAKRRARRGELDEEVAIGNGVHGVLRDLRAALGIDEAERLRRELAVDRQRSAGDGPGAERAPVGVRGDICETGAVAVEHFHPSEQVVRKKHRLGALEVRVARDQHIAMRRGHREQGALRAEDFFAENGAGVFEPQAHIGRDLVVATARGVEFGGGRHALREGLLDVHVHVFELGVPLKRAGVHLGQDGVEAGVNSVALLRGDEPDVREHRRMGLAARDIEGRKAAVKRDGLAKLEHQLGGARREASAPSHVRVLLGHSSTR